MTFLDVNSEQKTREHHEPRVAELHLGLEICLSSERNLPHESGFASIGALPKVEAHVGLPYRSCVEPRIGLAAGSCCRLLSRQFASFPRVTGPLSLDILRPEGY